MLNEILSYARDQGLVAEPGFTANKEVHWALCFRDGVFIDALRLPDPDDPKRGRRFARAPELRQPELVRGGGGGKSQVLAEALSKLVIWAEDGTDEEVAKLTANNAYFVAALLDFAQVAPSWATVAAALHEPNTLAEIRAALAAKKAKRTEKATLMQDEVLLLDHPTWIPWWRARYQNEFGAPPAEEADQMVCLATGDLTQPVPTHAPLRGIPGANPTGALLVSFDKPAFCSYGLAQSRNAAMSSDAATTYQAALNDLAQKHLARLDGNGVLYWYAGAVPADDDILAFLTEPPEQAAAAAEARARALLAAIRAGTRPELGDARFFALTLQGSGARVMVRDWMQGRFEDLVVRIDAWLSDLAIVGPNGSLTRSPTFKEISWGVGPRRGPDVDPLPPSTSVALWRAALQGHGIPLAAVSAAVSRERAMRVGGDKSDDSFTAQIARMGLLRAYHRRKKGGHPMSERLDPKVPDVAYHCGRLLAVLEGVQRQALGDVNANIIQRYYASASATPALVLGRIVRTSQHHLAKLDGGLRITLDREIASVMAHIDRFPAVLDLEGQSMFALGYYHQLADRHTRIDAAKARKAADRDAATTNDTEPTP